MARALRSRSPAWTEQHSGEWTEKLTRVDNGLGHRHALSSLRLTLHASMWQRNFAPLARHAARHTLQRRGFSSDGVVGNVQAAMAAFEAQRSLQPHPRPPSAPVQPAQQQKASAASSFMQVVFLGSGVGKFELELIRGSPQLSDVALRSEATKEQKRMMEAQAAEVAAKFDLSFVPPPAASDASSSRSSWVTDQNASSSMDPAEVARAVARQNANKPASSAWQEELNRPAPPRPSPATAAASPAPKSVDRALPDSMHLIINSSVVVYQNCMVRHTGGERAMWRLLDFPTCSSLCSHRL